MSFRVERLGQIILRELGRRCDRESQSYRYAQQQRPLLQIIPLHDNPSLAVEVKADQQFAGVDVCGVQAESWTGPILVQPVVLVVPGKTGAAGHERVIAVAD